MGTSWRGRRTRRTNVPTLSAGDRRRAAQDATDLDEAEQQVRARGTGTNDDFYEDDEAPEAIQAIRQREPDLITRRPAYARGGEIPARPIEPDEVLAVLSPGEYLVPAEMLRALGPGLLDRLNEGEVST